MPRAAILGFDGCHASTLGGYADVLHVANAHLVKARGKSAKLFEWQFVAMDDAPVLASNGLPLQLRKVQPRERFDLVFVPSLHYAGHREFDQFLARHEGTARWLTGQWERGAWLVANCTATFLLGATGLLDGRTATTTWWLEAQFKARFPDVKLSMRPVVTEDERLVCAGASASYLLQAVRVVERFAGASVAAQCARTMLIDTSRTSQMPCLPLLAETEHADTLVQRAQQWLQQHMTEQPRMAALAAHLAVSERTLARRFQAALGHAPLTYLQHLRIDSARALLEGGDLRVEQVAAMVGYADTSSFARLFRSRVGLAPGAYRARFQANDAPWDGV
jgi:transcriptional regulator GlxA family with amidase domain